MRIAIASDHAAIELKAILRDWLLEEGHEVADLGPETAESVDYPDFGYDLAAVVGEGTAEFGVALCGSGIGVAIAVIRNAAASVGIDLVIGEILFVMKSPHPIGYRIAKADSRATALTGM